MQSEVAPARAYPKASDHRVTDIDVVNIL